METMVELRTRGRGSSQQAWLEVSFAGLHPPVQLFDDLSMVGWTTPPIPPPPASAIDWTTPDPGTGQSFTLKDYLVEHLVIDPPKGTGPLGRWTDADRKILYGANLPMLVKLAKTRDGDLDTATRAAMAAGRKYIDCIDGKPAGRK